MENGNESPSPLIENSLLERLKSWKAIGAIALVAFLLFSRLWDPGLKAVQHDESMFAYYSWIIYEKTEHDGFSIFSMEKVKSALAAYQYLPIMHGPFLEFVTAGIFYIFGDSDATMRLGCIFSGLLIFLSLYLLRREIGVPQAWLAIFLIGLCPTLTFVTRYLRPDMYVIFMYIAAIHAGWRYAQTLRPWRLMVFLLVGWIASMTHETYFIFYFFMITFGIGCWIHGCVHPEKYADEDFSPKGGGVLQLPPAMKVVLRYAVASALLLALLYWLGWLSGSYVLIIGTGILLFGIGEFVPGGGRRLILYSTIAFLLILVRWKIDEFVPPVDAPEAVDPHASARKIRMYMLLGSGALSVIFSAFELVNLFDRDNSIGLKGIMSSVHRRLFPQKAVPFYREVRYALTYHWPVILISCLVGLFITVAFHTSFFNYMNHKWGQVEAFQFWQNEHKHQRIFGEFHFHLILLLIYEMPLLILFVVACVRQMWAETPSPTRLMRRALFIVWLILSALILIIPAFWTEIETDSLWNAKLDERWYKLLHMTKGFHLWMFIQCLLVVFITGWIHLNKKRVFHALCDYWFIGSFLAYNYAGEKVPWVLAHIVLPMMISCALYIWMIYEKYFVNAKAAAPASATPSAAPTKKSKDPKPKRLNDEAVPASASFWAVVFAIAGGIGKILRLLMSRHCLTALALISLAWTAYVWTLLVFIQPGSPIERHTYASSHTQFHEAIREVVRQCNEKYSGYDTPIIFGGTAGFPLNWLLRDFKNKHTFSGSGISPNGTKLLLPVREPIGGVAEPVFVIMDNVMFEKSNPGPMFKDRYVWLSDPPVRFRHYWTPVPLNWEKMKQIGLLFRSEQSLRDDPQRLMDRKTCVKEWKKFLVAYFIRDEELTRDGAKYEWLYLGGYNVYIGRLRSDLPPEP